MISAIVISVLLRSFCFYSAAAQNPRIMATDDESNWAEILNVMNASTFDGSRSDDDLHVFERILRSNAIERGMGNNSSDEILLEGDILMVMEESSIDDYLNSGSLRQKRGAGRKRRSINIWQRNKIAYVLDSSLGSKAVVTIKQAIKEWEATIPCMGKWRDVTNGTSMRTDHINFFKGKGCYSQVGRRRGQQVISIGERCVHYGIIIHEIGHAMGFYHEQSRPDRDSYVKINWNNILPGKKSYFYKNSAWTINSLGVPYDYASVMHYGPRAFSKDGVSLTIEVKSNGQGIKNIWQRQGLSDKNKQQAQKLYGCKVVGSCQDSKKQCRAWGKAGYCNKIPKNNNTVHIKEACCKTCRLFKTVLPCDSLPCLNDGKCSNRGTTFKCSCISGFKGKRCEHKTLPCDSSPCLNGGKCSNKKATYTFKCRCVFGFKGKRCEHKAVHGGCQDRKKKCWTWGKSGFCKRSSGINYVEYMNKVCCQTCQSIYTALPCDSSPCLNGGKCDSRGTAFKCRCDFGFEGIRCEHKTVARCQDNKKQCRAWGKAGYCKKSPGNKYAMRMKKVCCKTCKRLRTISPCDSSPCLNGGKCRNRETTFKCSCFSGFKGIRCEHKTLPCDSSPCLNGGKCKNKGTKFKCSCFSGFKGIRCEHKVSPCDSSPCLNGGKCRNRGTTFKCSCFSGFKGIRCGHKISPCNSSPCLNGGKCKNKGTRFKCSCFSGFKGIRCEHKVFPCDSAPCLNGGKCRNRGTTFKCSCFPGFKGLLCEHKSCLDNVNAAKYCKYWSDVGYCSGKWESFMKANCAKSCGCSNIYAM